MNIERPQRLHSDLYDKIEVDYSKGVRYFVTYDHEMVGTSAKHTISASCKQLLCQDLIFLIKQSVSHCISDINIAYDTRIMYF